VKDQNKQDIKAHDEDSGEETVDEDWESVGAAALRAGLQPPKKKIAESKETSIFIDESDSDATVITDGDCDFEALRKTREARKPHMRSKFG